MATVSFKKGLLANLPTSYAEGTFYVTTDEHALYLDVDGSTRVRIGDFQEFDSLEALQKNTNPSTTAMYYIKDLNVLAKWNGSSYVQINPDTGATQIEVTGAGNAVTAASYDPASRKITLTMGETFATPGDVDTKIAGKIGEIGVDTVKEYVDAKTEGIASDEALTTLSGRVDAAEADIDALESKVGSDTVSNQIDAKITALDLPNTYDAKGAAEAVQSTVDTLIGADTGKSVRTIANEELAAQLIPEGADESLNTLQEIAAWIQAHPDDAAAMNAAITALQSQMNGIDAGDGAVKKYVDDAIAALSIGDYAKASELAALAARVDTLEGTSHTHSNKDVLDGIDAGKVSAWDAAEQNAKDYADGLAVNYDAAGSANTAETNAKEYTDTMLAWGDF